MKQLEEINTVKRELLKQIKELKKENYETTDESSVKNLLQVILDRAEENEEVLSFVDSNDREWQIVPADKVREANAEVEEAYSDYEAQSE